MKWQGWRTRLANSSWIGWVPATSITELLGLGRELVSAAEPFARESGACFVDLTVVHPHTKLPPL
jgi:hypothetical protein